MPPNIANEDVARWKGTDCFKVKDVWEAIRVLPWFGIGILFLNAVLFCGLFTMIDP